MCYFHVVNNIRKHKNLIKNNKYEEHKCYIKKIHTCSSVKEFEEMKIKLNRHFETNNMKKLCLLNTLNIYQMLVIHINLL